MRLNTASETISFLKDLESRSAGFYEALARSRQAEGDLFLAFAKENRKNITNIERTYFGAITDALEGCFAFEIDPEAYVIRTEPPAGTYPDALAKALEMEGTIVQFYLDAAGQSRCLMADVPRVMERIAKARGERRKRLQELLDKVG
jgi:hypothetical protein